MRDMRRLQWVTLCLGVGLALGCGRTGLWSAEDEAAGTGGASSVGGATLGGSGASTGGKLAAGGTLALGGMLTGGVGTAGSLVGGSPNATCDLSVGDCRVVSEPECADTFELCTGEVVEQQEVDANAIFINDLAISESGRVALAGRFRGKLDFGGSSKPLLSAETAAPGTDGFVVSLDASGIAQWSYRYSRDPSDDVTGLRFAPDGELVLQGRDATGVFVQRLDANGEVSSSQWTANTGVEPGRVGMDSDGHILLSGNYSELLSLGGAQLSRSGRSGYLVKLDSDGQALWAVDTIPTDWASCSLTGFAVDANDDIVVVGNGLRNDGGARSFIQKFDSSSTAIVAAHLPGELTLRGVAVDGNLRIVVAGTFDAKLRYSGAVHEVSNGSAADVWIAQLTRAADLIWQKSFASGTAGASVDAVAVDSFANLVVVGNGLELNTSLPKPSFEKLYALKLRPDGRPIWSRSFFTGSIHSSLGIDNHGSAWIAGMGTVDSPGMFAFLNKILP